MDMAVRYTVQLLLTRREFNLVSKALTGTLESRPKLDRDGSVVGNDIDEARQLGAKIVRERICQARDYADRLESSSGVRDACSTSDEGSLEDSDGEPDTHNDAASSP